MAYTLNDNLKCWAEQYETAEFIQSDPVQIPHRYDSRVNIEISAFVTAWIAWGSRKQIIQKAVKWSQAEGIVLLVGKPKDEIFPETFIYLFAPNMADITKPVEIVLTKNRQYIFG